MTFKSMEQPNSSLSVSFPNWAVIGFLKVHEPFGVVRTQEIEDKSLESLMYVFGIPFLFFASRKFEIAL
jgi:hypothetical protein